MTDIDPSKVEAGDTVTVAGTNTAHLEYTVTGVVWKPSHSPGQLWVGPVALDATTLTITDHQPAKPEWAPGTFGTATVSSADSVTPRTVKGVLGPDGMFAYATYDVVDVAEAGQWTDFVPAVVPERYRPVAPEWEPGTVYEITTRDDDTVDAWCITGASPGHVVFLDQDGEEYDPSELLAITPQTSVDFTVAALRAEVSKLQTVINITDQAGADILDERNELLAEVERLRDARTLPTREQVESTLSKVLYATPYGELGWAPHRGRWVTNAAASDALAALLAPSVFALFEQGGAAQNQDAEGCPDDCGGCACHIAPPCSHCVEHTTDDDA